LTSKGRRRLVEKAIKEFEEKESEWNTGATATVTVDIRSTSVDVNVCSHQETCTCQECAVKDNRKKTLVFMFRSSLTSTSFDHLSSLCVLQTVSSRFFCLVLFYCCTSLFLNFYRTSISVRSCLLVYRLKSLSLSSLSASVSLSRSVCVLLSCPQERNTDMTTNHAITRHVQ